MGLSQNTTWTLIQYMQKLFQALPYKTALQLGGALGTTLWALSKKRVDKAEKRCVEALGVGVTTARHIVRRSYLNLGRSAAEFVRLPKFISSLDSFVTVHGEENLRRAYEKGNGVILITGHIGNWEIAAASIARMGYPMNAIGAEQRDERITDMIIEYRKKCNVSTISKGFSLKAAMTCLRKGEVLAILIDQDVRDKGIIAPFLGLPASTPYGPIKMSLKYECPMVPVFIIRRVDGVHHDLYFLPPFEDSNSEKFGENLAKAVTICNNSISSWISQYPDQWMWLYPRWASTMGK